MPWMPTDSRKLFWSHLLLTISLLAPCWSPAAHAFSLPWRKLVKEGPSPLSCFQLLEKAERLYNIPPHLLQAIALTESGRSLRNSHFIPWPWTINVNGKGYFFRSKEEAIQATRRFQNQGIRSIDVGCMQINLHHHPHAFASLEDAFDPAINIRYGAQFLRRLKAQKGGWHLAIAHYHSSNPVHYEAYRQRVLKQWQTTRASPPSLHEVKPTQTPNLIPLMRAHLSAHAVPTPTPLRHSPSTSTSDQEPPPIPVTRVSAFALKRAGQTLTQKVKQNLLAVSQSNPHTGHAPHIKKTPPLRASYSTRIPHLRPHLIASTALKCESVPKCL